MLCDCNRPSGVLWGTGWAVTLPQVQQQQCDENKGDSLQQNTENPWRDNGRPGILERIGAQNTTPLNMTVDQTLPPANTEHHWSVLI